MASITFSTADGKRKAFDSSCEGGWGAFEGWAKRELLTDREAWVAIAAGDNRYSIGNEGIQALSKVLPALNTIQGLWLGQNKISAGGMQTLSEALISLKALQSLDLSSNRIGDEGIHMLSKALPSLKALTQLGLASNQIGTEGMQALSTVLPPLTALRMLDLSHNAIGDEGMTALSNALPSLTTLKQLRLLLIDISDEGIQTLSEVLLCLKNLQELHLMDRKLDDQSAMLLYMSLDKAGRRNVTIDVAEQSISSWRAYDVAVTKFRPSRQFASLSARLWFGVQCLVFLSDAILDVTTTITLWQEGNSGWGALMLCLYLLPAIMVIFEEGDAFSVDGFLLKIVWFFGTATQAIPIYYMWKSFHVAKESQQYVRSNARQVVYESVPQAWLQFYIFLREYQLRCDAQQSCSLDLNRSTQLLLVSFAFSILSTAWALGSLQWARMDSVDDDDNGNALTCLKEVWQQAMQVHMLHFLFEATSRMATVAMLGLMLRGWTGLFALLGMVLLRVLLLSFGPVSQGSSERMRSSPQLLLSKSVQAVASAYFCDTALWMNRACVLLSAGEGIAAIGLFASSRQNLPTSLHSGVVAISAVCLVIASMGMLVRPFPSVGKQASGNPTTGGAHSHSTEQHGRCWRWGKHTISA